MGSVNLYITPIYSVVLNQELYQNLKEIVLSTYVQALLDLLREEPRLVNLFKVPQLIVIHQHNSSLELAQHSHFSLISAAQFLL